MARKRSKMAAKLDQSPDGSSTSSSSSSSSSPPLSSPLSSFSHALSDVLRASHRRLLTPRALDNLTQYDALPVGAAGAYDPAADEIDYTCHQHGRHNRRRLLYQQLLGPGEEALDEVGRTAANPAGSRRKNHIRGLPSATNGVADLADPDGDVGSEEGELSTDTLYLFLLVFASSAFSMWAAYLALT